MSGGFRAAQALQTVAVGAVLAFCLHTTAGVVQLRRAATVGAALLQDPAAALAAANAMWKPDEPASAPVTSEPMITPPPAEMGPEDALEPLPAPTPAATAEPCPEGWGAIWPQHYTQGTGPGYAACGRGSIKNCTALSDQAVAEEAARGLPFKLDKNSGEVQVLIMHTHATETYNLQSERWFDPDWGARTTDTDQNVCAVGRAMADTLNEAGFKCINDETLHDYPSYNGSYAASNKTVRAYLKQYPAIRVVIDLHRDAVEREGRRVKPIARVNNRAAAQLMLICGCDRGGNLPNYRQNLRFAAAFENQLETDYPGLTRPVLFDYRYYNQDLTTGSLLLEVGGHANTLDEAVYAGELAGKALGHLFEER